MTLILMLLAILAGSPAFEQGSMRTEVGVATYFKSTGDRFNPDPRNACYRRAPKVSKTLEDHALVFAHRTLPCGSWALVYNVRTGKSVVARKVDWGPKRNLIDLSIGTARAIGLNGKEEVVVVPLGPWRGARPPSIDQKRLE